MERAKKMVLISTENLERMQQQLHRRPISDEPKENALPSENAESANSSVQTPGTPLSRLDAEMSRILNSPLPRDENERWKMYREVLWRYLHFIQEAQRRNDVRGEDENENNDTRGIAATTGETTLDADVFRDLSRESPVKLSHSTSIIMRNDDTAKERERLLKTTGRILETVPKSYRARARLLMKHLHDKAVPTRISWNDEGIVTIDGNVVKDSNIADLINDAMRERKTTRAEGRAQFARLLRALNIPSVLVGNRELLSATDSSFSNIKKLGQPSTSSTPIVTRGRPSRASKRRKGVEKRKIRECEEKGGDCSLFLTPYFRGTPITFMKNVDSPSARKRRLLDWSKLSKR